jgi:2-polyprenyl-6-hydroxyphenyl methylase/3-demethylubiquinone-9 3-methyltransferase
MEIVTNTSENRRTSFGQDGGLSPLDRFGVWLSERQVVRQLGALEGKRLGDFGCGHYATVARTLLPRLAQAVLVDVAIAPDLHQEANVRVLEGVLPEVLEQLPSASLDIVLCLSVLEHVWEPQRLLDECRRLLAPGGVCLVNVPNWLGKRALEFSAFRLGLSPAEEMDDHKMYYDPSDLWPCLVRAGFAPHGIRCSRHKFGLNTFAVCRVDG